ncbi:hypothetical protein BGHDH14_bgh02902 [Blumeria hordei DH14]|uniref:SF3 helicase domain-containing protein n=1 Tax=Blumeria graminis f. sp. hordei (strain DH14) TaxID=546991 RepID=N1JQ33_BLUG1|nr:hypothetical protein BGHDH14_bgh02902 [Blumeria hordei DH14]
MENTNWTQSLQQDVGWNRPYLDDESLVPRKYNTLRIKLIEKGLVCNSNGNVYIFLPVLNKWAILCSDEAIKNLNSMMQMDSASVSYYKAFRPYISFLERSSTDNIATSIPTSVCIGTNRLRVARQGDSLTLTKCEAILVKNPAYGKSTHISSLCYMPLSICKWPSEWTRTDEYSMYKFVSPLFSDPGDLLTIEWALGNALLDPVHVSKAIILYGEGGTGNSTLLAAIKTSLMGCCGSIPDNALVGMEQGMSDDVASIVVSNRIVTACDVGGLGENTNLSVIKSLTGHDYISIPPLSARSSCSLIYATNRLESPKGNSEWMSATIMRRVVVVSMNSDALSFTERSMPQDLTSRLDFALRCIHTRLVYPHMPVSPLSVILTLTGSSSSKVLQYLKESNSEDITDTDGNIVLSIIAGAVGVECSVVGEMARKISLSAVKQVRNLYHIVGAKPSDFYYTKFGYK